jgi:hypothetical protein
MPMLYNDAYGNSKFAKIKGDKRDASCKLIFEEIKIYKHENSYVLAGQFILFGGLSRAYGQAPINPGLCELYLYGSEYEERRKNPDTKAYETIKLLPSKVEKVLYDAIDKNPSAYIQDGKALKGEITFTSDDSCSLIPENIFEQAIISSFKIEVINSTGKYEDWTPPKPYNGNGNGNYKALGLSPTEKILILKKELAGTIAETSFKEAVETMPLAAYVHKVIQDNEGRDDFLGAYFQLLCSVFN